MYIHTCDVHTYTITNVMKCSIFPCCSFIGTLQKATYFVVLVTSSFFVVSISTLCVCATKCNQIATTSMHNWSLKCAVNTRVGVEWEQPLLTKCPNGYAPHTASDSKVLTLPSRGGTVSTNGERRKARHWRSNQLLWTDGVHQLKRQFI